MTNAPMAGGSVNGAASVAKPSGDREGGQKTANRNDGAGGNQASPVAPPIKQAASPNEAAVAKSQAQTEQPDPYKLRDLNAQEDMAYWAMWMFIAALATFLVTSLGTFLIWRQVKLTRLAVEDTSEATEAMRGANQIAKDAQRPWLKIEVNLTEANFSEEVFTIKYDATITNIGKMVAERCSVRGNFIERDDLKDGERAINKVRQEAEALATIMGDADKVPYPILPGEPTIVKGWLERSGDFKPYEVRAGENRAIILIFVCARYHLPGEKEIRRTDRAFRIEYVPEGGDTWEALGIPLPIPDDFSTERLLLRPAGHNRTT